MTTENQFIEYKLRDWIDPEKLDWEVLSFNPNAIPLLEKNPDKIDNFFISKNPNAIPWLEKNQDKVEWNMISTNPSIFEPVYNYEKMKERMSSTIAEELMRKTWHPSRIEKWLDMGVDLEDL